MFGPGTVEWYQHFGAAVKGVVDGRASRIFQVYREKQAGDDDTDKANHSIE